MLLDKLPEVLNEKTEANEDSQSFVFFVWQAHPQCRDTPTVTVDFNSQERLNKRPNCRPKTMLLPYNL